MKLFNSGPSPHHTALAMVGAKPGEAVLSIGCGDPDLIGEIGRVTGLNGRMVATDPDPDAAARIDAAAARSGALVDFHHQTVGPQAAASHASSPSAASTSASQSPLGAGAIFDVVIVQRPLADLDPAGRKTTIAEAVGWARPGGRVVLVQGTRRAGFLLRRPTRSSVLPEAEAHALLVDAGAIAVRTLATTQGVTYIEARTRRADDLPSA